MSKERNEHGQFTETVTLADVLAVFEEVDGPVVTSSDVAKRAGCSQDSARRKLGQLRDRGKVESRKTAGRLVYWRTDAADPSPVNPDDPFFTDFPTFSTGDENLSERVDEILYGKEA